MFLERILVCVRSCWLYPVVDPLVRRIRSFVGSASDRTICKFDYFFRALKTLALYTTYEYQLYDSADNVFLMAGLYIIVDGLAARYV